MTLTVILNFLQPKVLARKTLILALNLPMSMWKTNWPSTEGQNNGRQLFYGHVNDLSLLFAEQGQT